MLLDIKASPASLEVSCLPDLNVPKSSHKKPRDREDLVTLRALLPAIRNPKYGILGSIHQIEKECLPDDDQFDWQWPGFTQRRRFTAFQCVHRF